MEEKVYGHDESFNNVEVHSKKYLDNQFVNKILDLIYPVGSIYMSMNSTSPETLFGGTWERVANGKTLVGVDESDNDFSTPKKSGGAKSVTLNTSQIPSHNHSGSTGGAGAHTPSGSISTRSIRGTLRAIIYSSHGASGVFSQSEKNLNGWIESGSSYGGAMYTLNADHNHTFTGNAVASHTHSVSIGNSGGGQAHTNLQPYITTYIWVRTA